MAAQHHTPHTVQVTDRGGLSLRCQPAAPRGPGGAAAIGAAAAAGRGRTLRHTVTQCTPASEQAAPGGWVVVVENCGFSPVP